MPAEIKPDFSPLSEKELAKLSVTDFDQFLPKLILAAAYLRDVEQSPDIQKARIIIESSVSLLERAAA
jgi:hypothetical protein